MVGGGGDTTTAAAEDDRRPGDAGFYRCPKN